MSERTVQEVIAKMRDALGEEIGKAQGIMEKPLTLAEAELAAAYKKIGQVGLAKLAKLGVIDAKEFFPAPKWVAMTMINDKPEEWVPYPGSQGAWWEAVEELSQSGDLWKLGSAAEMDKAYNKVVRAWKKKMVDKGLLSVEPGGPGIAQQIAGLVNAGMEKAATMLAGLPPEVLAKHGITVAKK